MMSGGSRLAFGSGLTATLMRPLLADRDFARRAEVLEAREGTP